MPFNVKLLYLDNVKRDVTEVAGHITAQNIIVNDAFDAYGGCVIEVSTVDDVDNLLSHDVVEKLKEFNLKPVTPPNFEAQKTVFLTGIREAIASKGEARILSSINDLNPGLRGNKVFVINSAKFKGRYVLKVTLLLFVVDFLK